MLEQPPEARTRWYVAAGVWGAAAFVAGPLGIVLHEAAHAVVALGFGFDDVAIHAVSASFAESEEFWDAFVYASPQAAGELLPVLHVGLVAAAGVVATWALTLGAALLFVRGGLPPFVTALVGALALFSPLRQITGVRYMAFVRSRYPDAFPNFDEFRAAAATGVPVELFVVTGALVAAIAWYLVVREIWPKVWLVGLSLVGAVLGVVVWARAGEWILP